MSKRILILICAVGVLASSSAFADRARDLVLGTGDAGVVLGSGGSSGTFYTEDAYNMFYNPAYVNDYKNWAIIEKSNLAFPVDKVNATAGVPNGGSPTTTTSTGSTAEGGFVTSLGNFALGVYFNRLDDLQDAQYVGNGTTGMNDMRPIDVIFGGDTGAVKWGLGLTYAALTTTGTDGTNHTSSDLVVKGGASWNDFEPFIQWRALGTDDTVMSDTAFGGASATAPKNRMLMFGARYHWGEWTPYAVYKYTQLSTGVEATDYRAYGAGFGRSMKAADMVKLNYGVAYFRQSAPLGLNGTSTLGTRSVLPINVSVEGDATSWMTLRAGLGYNFIDQVGGNTGAGTIADNTTGRLGASFHFNKVDFDWAVGGGGANGGAEATQENSQNFDLANGFFTAASVSYHW